MPKSMTLLFYELAAFIKKALIIRLHVLYSVE